MTRQEAYDLAKPRFSNRNLFKHVLAVEAVMRELAAHLSHDVDQWGLIGLLHDLDYEATLNEPDRHTLVTEELLKPYGLPDEVISAIKAHNNLAPRETAEAKALYAADPVTGLIVAAVLMHPEKKLSALDVDFVLRRFKEKSFARGADRDQIRSCESLGLSLDEFIGIALKGMCRIADQLGF